MIFDPVHCLVGVTVCWTVKWMDLSRTWWEDVELAKEEELNFGCRLG